MFYAYLVFLTCFIVMIANHVQMFVLFICVNTFAIKCNEHAPASNQYQWTNGFLSSTVFTSPVVSMSRLSALN